MINKRINLILVLFFNLIFYSLASYANEKNETMLDRVERATFQWFLDHADPKTGLVLDRGGSVQAPASIAGTGFGLVVYAIAVERGWVTRKQAAIYTLKVVKGLYTTPQGPQAEGVSGYHGFFYHFLDPKTGLRSAPQTIGLMIVQNSSINMDSSMLLIPPLIQVRIPVGWIRIGLQ